MTDRKPTTSFSTVSSDGQIVTFTGQDILETLSFDTGRDLKAEEFEATMVYLAIDDSHVTDMADRVLAWRRMRSIKDIYLTEFEVTLRDRTIATFMMKDFLFAARMNINEFDFDATEVRERHKQLVESEGFRLFVYETLLVNRNRFN